MSSIKNTTISRKKKDLQGSKLGYLGTKHLRFNHQASSGDTSFNLLALSNGIPGFVQPNASDLAKVYAFKGNLRIFSSLDYELIPEKDYVVNGTTITFIGDMASAGAKEGEIFIGELQIPTSNAVVADAQQKVFDYILPLGTTTLSLGNSYRIGTKEILVYRNGKLQIEGATGNYIEVNDGNGYGTSIEFNTANGSFDDSIVVVFGLVFGGDISIFSDLERLSGSILSLAQDVALATGNPIDTYISATPSEVERDTFGTDVLQNKADIEDLKDPTQMSDALATKLGLKVYNPTVTTVSGNWVPAVSDFIPYQMQDGSWRLKFNLSGDEVPKINSITFQIGGVVFASTLAVVAYYGDEPAEIARTNNNTNTILVRGVDGTTGIGNFVAISGDVILASKPTWAI